MNPFLLYAGVISGGLRLSMMQNHRSSRIKTVPDRPPTPTNPIALFRYMYGDEATEKHMGSLIKEHYPQCYEAWLKENTTKL